MLVLKTSLIHCLYPFQVLSTTVRDVHNKYAIEESDSICPGEKGD